MKKIKAIAFLLFIAALLTCAAMLPIFLSHFQDQHLLGRIYTSKAKKTISMKQPSLSNGDRINMIYKYSRNSKNMVMVEKKRTPDMSIISEDSICKTAIKEIKKLQKIGVFPKIKLDYSYKVNNIHLMSFSDIHSPNASVQVWDISFSCGGVDIGVWLDDEKHFIYEFNVLSHTDRINNNNFLIKNEFSKYLNVKSSKVDTYYVIGSKWYEVGKEKLAYQYIKLDSGKTAGSYLVKKKKIK